MHDFYYSEGKLFCEGVAVEALAKKFRTPLYVYSHHTLTDHFLKLSRELVGLNPLICFAMKANSNLAILRTLANLGSGFDIVSGGELRRVLAAGGDPGKCVFAGVGKTEEEIELALRHGIYSFNVESEPELERIDRVARRMRKVAPVAVRVNPNVDAGTHAKITTGTYENKFGIAYQQVAAVYQRASQLKGLWLRGVQMHIGSQLTEVGPYLSAIRKILPLVSTLAKRHRLEFFSIGGGLGIVYQPALASGASDWWKTPKARRILTPAKYAEALVPLLKPLGLRILVEPGRFIVGNAGILVTRVEYVKRTGKKNFVIVDAAMNDLVRPAFYDSYHEIVPVQQHNKTSRNRKTMASDVVGPICESSDVFCKDRMLPVVREGEFLAFLSAGAYGFTMASNYNSRPMAAEVMVNGNVSSLIRNRQPVEQLWDLEKIPGWLSKKSAR